MTRTAKILLAALLGMASAAPTIPAGFAADLGVYSESDPGECAQPWVLKRISSKFRHQVTNVPNLPNVEILDFHRIHEHRYLPAHDDWQIGRRYCGATVALSDGRDREIWYLIEEGQGYASIGDNVEFCVSGFDRWNVYNSHCRILR